MKNTLHLVALMSKIFFPSSQSSECLSVLMEQLLVVNSKNDMKKDTLIIASFFYLSSTVELN